MKKKDKEKNIACECEDCNCVDCNCDGEECHCEGCSEGCSCGETCECEDCTCEHDIVSELQEKIKKLEEALLREKAEVQNYKRRKDEEVVRIVKYAEEDIVNEFLPILDNFERAINMDDNNLEDDVSKFLQGFKMIYCAVKNMLEKFEVKEIECLGKEFDPTYHQGVSTSKDDTKESGIILEVFQKGYMYKDKVIRPSMVKVNE